MAGNPACRNEFSYRISWRGDLLQLLDASVKNLAKREEKGSALQGAHCFGERTGLGLRLLVAFTEVRGTGFAATTFLRSALNFGLSTFIVCR